MLTYFYSKDIIYMEAGQTKVEGLLDVKKPKWSLLV